MLYYVGNVLRKTIKDNQIKLKLFRLLLIQLAIIHVDLILKMMVREVPQEHRVKEDNVENEGQTVMEAVEDEGLIVGVVA